MIEDKNRLVEVCGECSCASCYHGFFMCSNAKSASTELKRVEDLNAMNLEHPEHYSRSSVFDVYGEVSPHGYANKD